MINFYKLVCVLLTTVIVISQQVIITEGLPTNVVLSPRNDLLLLVEDNTLLSVWTYNATNQLYERTQNISSISITAVCSAPASDAIITVSQNATVSVYQRCSNTSQFQLTRILVSDATCSKRGVSRVAVNSNLSQLVTVSINNNVLLWDVNITSGMYTRMSVNVFADSVQMAVVGNTANKIGVVLSNSHVTSMSKPNSSRYSIDERKLLDPTLALQNNITSQVVVRHSNSPDWILNASSNSLNHTNLEVVSGINGRCLSSGCAPLLVQCPNNNGSNNNGSNNNNNDTNNNSTNTTSRKLSTGGIVALSVAIPVGVIVLGGIIALIVAGTQQNNNGGPQSNPNTTSAQQLYQPQTSQQVIQPQPPAQPQPVTQPQTHLQPTFHSQPQIQVPHAAHHVTPVHVAHHPAVGAHAAHAAHGAHALSGGAIAGIALGSVAAAAAIGGAAALAANHIIKNANKPNASNQPASQQGQPASSQKQLLHPESTQTIELEWT